ncbi:hypothetical protein D917_00417 [Trichinella nativa]|uniref:Uncharacterized protein n=1 Tax=Trichinella nativa TaxID=6335 RepID=A0A1Y3EBW9_9BILA|nr:hypothetical protein D917_00417 [Trichinella nativa]
MQRSTRTWGTQRPPASTSKSWQPTSETRLRLPESSAAQQMRQRYYYDRKTGNPYYETHEAVWLYCSASKSRPSRKFTTPWTGPFGIVKEVSGCAACDKRTTKIRNKFDVITNPKQSPEYIAHDWCGLKKTMDVTARHHKQW